MYSDPNILQQLFGFSAFREGQKEAVESLLGELDELRFFFFFFDRRRSSDTHA